MLIPAWTGPSSSSKWISITSSGSSCSMSSTQWMRVSSRSKMMVFFSKWVKSNKNLTMWFVGFWQIYLFLVHHVKAHRVQVLLDELESLDCLNKMDFVNIRLLKAWASALVAVVLIVLPSSLLHIDFGHQGAKFGRLNVWVFNCIVCLVGRLN